MPSAQGMAAEKVESISRGMGDVSISSAPPAAATAPAAAGQGGVEESKDKSDEQSCVEGEEEDEDDIDENDPLWKVSAWCCLSSR